MSADNPKDPGRRMRHKCFWKRAFDKVNSPDGTIYEEKGRDVGGQEKAKKKKEDKKVNMRQKEWQRFIYRRK